MHAKGLYPFLGLIAAFYVNIRLSKAVQSLCSEAYRPSRYPSTEGMDRRYNYLLIRVAQLF